MRMIFAQTLTELARQDKDICIVTPDMGYSILDYNGHMNNTYYADILCDCVPELGAGTHRVESFRIHYNKEAPLGDILTINGANPEQGKYIFRSVKTNGEINIDAEIRLTEL